MNTSKVANTPKNKTPNSAKRKKGSAVKAQVDTPRPNLSAKKILSAKRQNGLKSSTTPKSKNATPKTPKSNTKKSIVKKVEEEEEDEDEEEDEMDVDHIKELVMASDEDDEEDDDEEDDDDDEDDDEEDDDDDEEIDENDLEKMLKAIRGKDTKKVTTPAKTPKADKAKKTEAVTPAQTPKAKKTGAATPAKTPKAKKTEAATPAKTPKAKKTEAATPAKTPKAKKTEAATPAKIPKANKAKKTKAATPAKTPKDDKAKKTETEEVVPDDIQNIYQEQLKYFNERNKRTLFIKRFPSRIRDEEISKLSSDILVVRLRISRDSSSYAFVEFKDEETAKKNVKILSECSFDGTPIFVDYATTKTTSAPKKKVEKLDPKKLYVTGFPQKTTLEDLQKLIPKATITLPIKALTNLPLGYAFAKFETVELCTEALKHLQGKMLNGTPLIVLYAKLVSLAMEKKRKLDKPKGEPAVKKIKLDKKKKVEEEEEEEDDDDDDDEEDDDEEGEAEEADDDDDDDDDDEEEEDDE